MFRKGRSISIKKKKDVRASALLRLFDLLKKLIKKQTRRVKGNVWQEEEEKEAESR